MDPYIERHCVLKTCENVMPSKVLRRAVAKAMLGDTDCRDGLPPISRLASVQPECFAPNVDPTRARKAFGRLALPKLIREIESKDTSDVKRAITTMADVIYDPKELAEAIKLGIPDRLSEFLVSNDTYLRDRAAAIYTTVAGQSVGREAILKNVSIIYHLAKGLIDRMAVIRFRVARAVETLSRCWIAAKKLCTHGFVDIIIDRISCEKEYILVVHLETLQSLLYCDIKDNVVKINTMETLVTLLDKENEDIISGALACLAILCEEPMGKQRALDIELLPIVRSMLSDERAKVRTKAAHVLMFITITTPGKLQALNLETVKILLRLASDYRYRELQLLSLKILTNLADIPEGRATLLDEDEKCIENINVYNDETVERHRQILLSVISSEP